jgi:hypothetical protein
MFSSLSLSNISCSHLGTQIVNIVWAPLLETWVIIELHNSHILWKSDYHHPDQQLELEPELMVSELSIIAELEPVAKEHARRTRRQVMKEIQNSSIAHI